MTKHRDLSYFRECFDYDPDTGRLSWKSERPLSHFNSDRYRRTWNTLHGGKPITCVTDNGYIVLRFDGRKYFAHRVCFALDHGIEISDLPEQIDHRDTDRTNNRRVNLRAATASTNQMNRSLSTSASTSGLKGVSWHKAHMKWRSSIQVNGKQKHLGLFDDPLEAHAAYVQAANDNFHDFARAA